MRKRLASGIDIWLSIAPITATTGGLVEMLLFNSQSKQLSNSK